MSAATKIPLSAAQVVAFAPTKNLQVAQTFYEETLGLPLIAKDGFGLMFEVDGARIRVAKVETFEPASFTILGWRVPDVLQTVSSLAEHGVVFERYHGMKQDDFGIWSAPSGARVAWFKDPDGNVLSVSQQV
jgi:catechol 2,3-dioxygenase-like lactoylglutathione lyase family enzyme